MTEHRFPPPTFDDLDQPVLAPDWYDRKAANHRWLLETGDYRSAWVLRLAVFTDWDERVAFFERHYVPWLH